MGKVRIEIEVDDEYADPAHEMGVTNEGYERIVDALMFLSGNAPDSITTVA